MPVFWNALTTKLTDRWVASAGPASVYWLGLLVAWYAGHGGSAAAKRRLDMLGAQPAGVQVATLAAALVALLASGVIVQRLTYPVLRLLEGHWPRFLDRPRRRLAGRAAGRRDDRWGQWCELEGRIHDGTARDADLVRHGRLDSWLRHRPAGAEAMPTRLGNILGAAESRSWHKYGLDAAVVWPHLWLLLPQQTREDVAAARKQVDSAAAAGLWALLALPAAVWTPWAAPAAVAVVLVCWGWLLPDAAVDFGDLLEAAFDLHRIDLYRALRWPLPANPVAERAAGESVTAYLHRGGIRPEPEFTGDR
ncbi:hypothetical protein GA0115240_101422 [Streptomyces sp. DvalAA-14]|uniref:hypothetical protein n=1 Tax=unclassified Streptomyces TaxID=2593676 RepID=UPI00081BA6B5|nr:MULTISPECIES: hypothetical protein [unclassified Streptomyces]MYS18864.1 hypothetical protein [Streptomyces sp. SID4948]SCD30770.1 hypothetical protein GA0115240_101422 [Streptomyces sp. DvalAA-14]